MPKANYFMAVIMQLHFLIMKECYENDFIKTNYNSFVEILNKALCSNIMTLGTAPLLQ